MDTSAATSPGAAEHQGRVRLHALVQCGHGQQLPLVNAEFGDVLVRSHVFCRPLLHRRPRVKVEHLRVNSRRASEASSGPTSDQQSAFYN